MKIFLYQALGMAQEAIACYQRTLQTRPNCAIAYGEFCCFICFMLVLSLCKTLIHSLFCFLSLKSLTMVFQLLKAMIYMDVNNQFYKKGSEFVI